MPEFLSEPGPEPMPGQGTSWHPQNEPSAIPEQNPPLEVIARGHEQESVGTWSVALTGVILVISLALIHWLMFDSLWFLEQTYRASEPVSSALRPLPPRPRLTPDQPATLRRLQAREQKILNSYGWSDPEHRTARIPIDRAMQLLIESQSKPNSTQK